MTKVATATELLRSSVGFLPKSCAACPLLKPCGGHQLEIIRSIGCASFAADRSVDANDMNPLNEERYWRLWNDVNGLIDFSISAIKPVNSLHLPSYVPLLQHRYSRSAILDIECVALNLYQVFRKNRDGSYRSRFANGAELRAYYRLRPDARIILSGVAIDRRLELFWAEHQKHNVPGQLASLEISAVTPPNFSFFTDVTRYQILRNRKRILLVSERLSKAGVPVAPHFNAITDRDWLFCEELLREHPQTSVVTLEFQTGLSTAAEAKAALGRVADIQQNIGRLLHPVLIGGAKLYLDAKQLFSRFTVIDSRPFMEAQARRTLVGDAQNGYGWKKSSTAEGAPIDDLLAENIRLYPEKLKLPVTQEYSSWEDPAQMELFDSRPYLIAQPVA